MHFSWELENQIWTTTNETYVFVFFTLPYYILTFLYRYSTCNCKISDFYQTLKKTFFPDFSVTVAPCWLLIFRQKGLNWESQNS